MQDNQNLQAYNTFGIAINAKRFGRFSNIQELASQLQDNSNLPLLILGGGSNVLFTEDYDGLVLRNEIKGIEVCKEDDQHIWIKAGAGEVWHDFVCFCIEHNWAGLENLSLIPGSVGASPMQNIGAYGVEIKDVFAELSAYHLETGAIHTFDKEACAFGYRESVFKRKFKNQYVILDVTYKLAKKANLQTTYGAIQQELEKEGITQPSIQDVSKAVIAIRQSKLPDPKVLGNAGSFFKNPVISREQFEAIKAQYPNIANYPVSESEIKLAAGWLIENAGLKGYKQGTCGVHEKQALVLVNYGNSTGQEILDLSTFIIEKIQHQFGVTLEREVNIIPNHESIL
ncbi:MAG: UDP-N-acetylmuramate dehydrogenase [Bacteroidota bacterium]|jgi:UDP-N-acetylmuramate dehydrogenase